jgi:hypothetical protein
MKLDFGPKHSKSNVREGWTWNLAGMELGYLMYLFCICIKNLFSCSLSLVWHCFYVTFQHKQNNGQLYSISLFHGVYVQFGGRNARYMRLRACVYVFLILSSLGGSI